MMKFFEQKKKKCSSWYWAEKHKDRVTVLDHDGWERRNFYSSMNQAITEQEWAKRVLESTCRWHKPPKYNHWFKLKRAFSSMLGALKWIVIDWTKVKKGE